MNPENNPAHPPGQSLAQTDAHPPLVSVGVPTYNRPEGLRQTLDALLRQTHGHMEIIVSDNASTDPRVGEVLEEFARKDDRIRVIRQKENIGFQNNFRAVFAQSRGEYFAWAADDDLWDTRFLEVCLGNLRHPQNQAVLACTHVRMRDADGNTVDEDYSDPIGTSGAGLFLRSYRYMHFTLKNHCFYGLYRRQFISPWFFARRFGYDFLAILILLRHGNIHVDNQVLFTSTVGGSGFERRNFHKYYDSRVMKICVNLSSTLTWMYEFLRCIWITPYRLREKWVLSFFTVLRFLRPRFWRRFAGDMLALATRRDIWTFEDR